MMSWVKQFAVIGIWHEVVRCGGQWEGQGSMGLSLWTVNGRELLSPPQPQVGESGDRGQEWGISFVFDKGACLTCLIPLWCFQYGTQAFAANEGFC